LAGDKHDITKVTHVLNCEVVSRSVGGEDSESPTSFYFSAKEAPQEQPCSAFGLPTIRNEERISSLWKSIVLPLSRSRESWSMTTFAPSLSKTLQGQVNKTKLSAPTRLPPLLRRTCRLVFTVHSRLNLYWKP